MGKFMTCLDCLSVEVERETGQYNGVPLVRRTCEDCGNREHIIRSPGREADLYDDFASLKDTEIVERREAAE